MATPPIGSSPDRTLAYAVERKLFDMGRAVYVLDGQNLRHDLNKGLPQDRAGRTEKPGEVLIQTRYPSHALYRSLLAHDYAGFAATTLEEVGFAITDRANRV